MILGREFKRLFTGERRPKTHIIKSRKTTVDAWSSEKFPIASRKARLRYSGAGMENIAGLMGFARSQLGERIPSHQEHNEITIFAIDLNNLSKANNTYGHDVRDAYIKAVADAIRNEGIALRMGGDEMLLARKFSGHDDVTETRKRIQETAVKNLLTRLEQMHVEEDEKQAKKNFAKALKAARKGRFSLALGSVSVVKSENMPEKQKAF